MNQVTYGCQRDREILELVSKHKALTTDQISAMLFSFKYGLRKAQERTLRLFKNKRIKRVRLSLDMPYVYFLGDKPGQPEHVVGVNWVYIWMHQKQRLSHWELPYHWEYEQDYGILRCDGLCGIQNKITDEISWSFIEFDRETGNKFTKVQQYNDLYEKQFEKLGNVWWYKKAKRFPRIIIVTETEKKKETIKKLVSEKNRNDLRFKVHLLKDIIEEVKKYG